MNDAERQQIDLFLDGDLSGADSTDLFARLEEDPEAAAYLAERAVLHRNLRASIKRRGLQQHAVAATPSDGPRPVSRAQPRTFRLPRRMLAAASIGLCAGILTASLAWGVALRPATPVVTTIFSDSFEDPSLEMISKFPKEEGLWKADKGQILASDSAVDGGHVVRFGPPNQNQFVRLSRIIAVPRPKPGQVGQRELRLSVAIRPEDASAVPLRYGLRMGAFSEDPATIRELWRSPGQHPSEGALTFTSRATTIESADWVVLEGKLPLPPEARHVVISIATKRKDAQAPGIAFHADALTLEMVTAPDQRL